MPGASGLTDESYVKKVSLRGSQSLGSIRDRIDGHVSNRLLLSDFSDFGRHVQKCWN